MKQIAVLILLSLLVACSPGENTTKKEELDSYRQKLEEYSQKVEKLEAELKNENDDSAPVESLPVEIKKMTPEVFSRYFEVTGVAEALQDAFISPETSGQIKEIAVKRGDRVKKGDLLIRLNTDITEKSMREIETNLELAQSIFNKQESLWKDNIGSELQYLEAKNTMESLKARLATLREQEEMAYLKAPFSGIIDDITVKEGELASPGMQLIHLVNLSRIRVSANISEAYLGSIQKGDLVDLSFPAYPDMDLKAGVTRLGEVIDPKTRTFTLEVELNNTGEKIKPNMLTSVRVQDFRNENSLVVPSFILRQDFNGTFLFRVDEEAGNNKAQKVYVSRGITVQDQTMITEGISAGDLVITKGFNLVNDGAPINIINP